MRRHAGHLAAGAALLQFRRMTSRYQDYPLPTFHDNAEARFSISDKSCEPRTSTSDGATRPGETADKDTYTKISSIDHRANSAETKVPGSPLF